MSIEKLPACDSTAIAVLSEAASKSQNPSDSALATILNISCDPACIDKFNKKLLEIETKTADIQKYMKADGSSKIKEKRSGIERFFGNIGATLLNAGKSFIGIDQDGKWDPLECLKNVGLTALCFVPYVGPAVRVGLSAYGLATGVPNLIEGIIDYNNASSDEEEKEDAAMQKIMGNVLQIGLSACGVKGVGKAFRTNPATAAKASVGKSAVSNFCKDMTVNAVKGAWHELGRGTTALKTITSSKFRTLSSLKKSYVKNVNKARKPITEEVTKLKSKIQSETNPNYKALYEEQFDLLKMKQEELCSIGNKTQTQMAELRTQNAVTRAQSRLASFKETADGKITFERNGVKYEIGKNDPIYKEFKSAIEKSNEAYAKRLADIITRKEQIMVKYAKNPEKYSAKLDKYTESPIRNKYTNAKELQEGINSLESKISETGSKITKLEAKLKKAENGQQKGDYQSQINRLKKLEASMKHELAVCKAIKFKKWYKPSTWRKNQYQLAIQGPSNLRLGSAITNNMYTHLGTFGNMVTLANRNPIYSDPCSTDLTPEQTAQLIEVMAKYYEAFQVIRQKLVAPRDDKQAESTEQLIQAYDELDKNFQQEVDAIISGVAPQEQAQSDEKQSADNGTATQNTSESGQNDETNTQGVSETEQNDEVKDKNPLEEQKAA